MSSRDQHAPIEEAELYAAFYHDTPTALLDFLLRWREAPGDVLDMGCGPGRILGALRARGWHVTGMDPNPSYCTAAASTGAPVRCGGLSDLHDVEMFDTILVVNDPLQYLLSVESRRDAIARLNRALRRQGRLLIDIANFHWILAHFRKPVPGRVVLDRHEVIRTPRYELDFHDATWTHIDEFEITAPSGEKRRAAQTHRLAMITYPEVAWMLRAAGFKGIETWPSFKSQAPGRCDGPRIIITCNKGV